MAGPFKMKGSPMARNFGAPFRDDKKKKDDDKLATPPGTTEITDADLEKTQVIEEGANKGNKKDQIIRKYMSGQKLTAEELAIFNEE